MSVRLCRAASMNRWPKTCRQAPNPSTRHERAAAAPRMRSRSRNGVEMPDLKEALRKLADEIESQEKGESSDALVARVEALEQRKPSHEELRAALAGLSEDDL